MQFISNKREDDFDVVKDKNIIKFTFFTKEGEGFNLNQNLLYTLLIETKNFDSIEFEFPNMIYLDSITIGKIIKSYKQAEQFEKKFIVRVNAIVYSLLRNMDITKLFTIEEYKFKDGGGIE